MRPAPEIREQVMADIKKEVLIMNIVTIDEVDFCVNDGVLISMEYFGSIPKSVNIPKILPGGIEIGAIGPRFCQGLFNAISVADSIEDVRCFAFASSNVHTIYWPTMCKRIPSNCFSYSTAKYIHGISDVCDVSSNAFAYSSFGCIHWPRAVTVIPFNCFYNCSASRIEDLELVTFVGEQAFGDSNIKELRWPLWCDTIPERCFKFGTFGTIQGLEYVSNIKSEAFSEVSSSTPIDFSGAILCDVADDAFSGVDPDLVVISPYYSEKLLNVNYS